MWRFAAGVCSALVLMTVGAVLWQSFAQPESIINPPTPAQLASSAPSVAALGPLEASEKTREERRFSRYDRDRNGAVSREEFLLSRRKNYTKLDTNGDGTLSFEEYAAKTTAKFTNADRDKTGALTPQEFLATRVVRKPPLRANCPPQKSDRSAPASDGEDG